MSGFFSSSSYFFLLVVTMSEQFLAADAVLPLALVVKAVAFVVPIIAVYLYF